MRCIKLNKIEAPFAALLFYSFVHHIVNYLVIVGDCKKYEGAADLAHIQGGIKGVV